MVLGRTFRLQNSSSEQIFDVEKYWIHEQYDDETYDNDIGETDKSHGNQILMITKTTVSCGRDTVIIFIIDLNIH